MTIKMWSATAFGFVCLLLGTICDVMGVDSQPNKVIQRKTNPSPDKGTELEEDIHTVIEQIHFLSKESQRSLNLPPPTEEGVDLNAYYAVLTKLYGLFQPLVKARFVDDLPKTFVCILSEREDCGLQAELTKTVSLELGKILLGLLSSMRSQTCSSLPPDEESNSFIRAYLRMGESTTAALSGFQQTVFRVLSNPSLSENVMNLVSGFTESAVIYFLKFFAVLLQVPMDYVRIALQFGIKIPHSDDTETCGQGDLKQLIMWGTKNNVSWSFGSSLIDILLEILLPQEESPYTNPGSGCQSPPPGPLRRSASETSDDAYFDFENLCEQRNLAKFNDTLCAEILAGSVGRSSPSVFTFCQALSSLTPNQIQKVWGNMCYLVQAFVSPLVRGSPECSVVGTPPPSTVLTSASELFPQPRSVRHRGAREAPNLRQLVCSYSSWLDSEEVDAVLVSLCSDNERVEFVTQVCDNDALLRKLLSDSMNGWLYGYCANSSGSPEVMVGRFCVYEQWIDLMGVPVDSSLLAFCLSVDGPRLTQLICEHTGFLMHLISNPDNWPLMPNCSNVPPPAPFPGPDVLQLQSCQYSEWQDVMQLTTEHLSKCILVDQSSFNKEVCSNKTFLNALLQNPEISWLENHCNTSLHFQYAEPVTSAPVFNITDWCDYHTWAERPVDVSVIGLCWHHDQLSFQEKVCCKASVLEKLLENPQNKWLSTSCTDIKEITMSPQVCRYSEWSLPIIVDMTELALCAEIDPLNFTSKVCGNETVLQNLLANQDNTWLIEHCSNHSGKSPGGGEGGGEGAGGGLTGFEPAEQCQYSSWSISPPGVALLTLCWEQDQSNFISSICPNKGLLAFLSREPSSKWVSSMCTTYTNYTTTTTTTTTTTSTDNTTTTTPEPGFCQARNLVKQFNWNCSNYFTSACQPCATQNMVLQTLVRCWVDSLSSRVEDLLTPTVMTVLDQVVSTSVVILLTLEDLQSFSWHVSDTIRQSVLKSVVDFFKTESNSDKKSILLQCFGNALTNLMLTTRDMTSDELLFIKGYFDLPLRYVRPVFSSTHIRTVRLILQYYSSNKDSLQLADEYLSTMVSVLLQTHMITDDNLFPELAPLLGKASPVDIQAFPPLQDNPNVIETINRNLEGMPPDLRQAFGSWYSKAFSPSDIIRGHQALIRDTGNLIAYLPFHYFQHFSAAQLLDGLDVLQRNSLTSLKKEFIARTLTSSNKNLTAQDFSRLGNIVCLADPEDLLVYKSTDAFRVIQDSIMNCTQTGLSLPSHLVSNLLLSSTDLQIPSSLTTNRLAELAPLMPSLGVTFLQNLTKAQLHSVLPKINSATFSPEQASAIVDKLSTNNTLSSAQFLELGSLIVGVKTEMLVNLTPDSLRPSLHILAQHSPDLCSPRQHGLTPPQANAIATKLWGFPAVVQWLDDVEALLPCTPLLSVLSRIHLLVNDTLNITTKSWNTQQAKAIFNQMPQTDPNEMQLDILRLGTVGQGVSCKVLQEHLRADPSPSSVRKVLAFLRKQPHILHTSLKKCLIEELYQFEFFSELIGDLGAEIALSMPISMIKKFPIMDSLRTMIIEDPRHFLLLSRMKQQLLVDKMVQRMNMYVGVFTEPEFRSLGIMATFVVDEVFIQVDRSFFTENLDFLRGLCYSLGKMEVVARILQDPDVFGPVQSWNHTTLSQVDRFLFFLPKGKLQKISPALMTVGRIEKLFISHRQWERGEIGMHCLDEGEREYMFEKQQFVLQFFLGFLKIYPNSAPHMIPTCEILHTTFPSAWTSGSLFNMSASAFSNCLELMGQDPFMAKHQRIEVLKKVKEIYGPVSSFSQSVISQMGRIAIELTLGELTSLRLTERKSIAAVGALSTWSKTQLSALFATVLNSTGKTPSQLDSSTLVAMGHIVCGANTTQMKAFNPIEFGKAVLWLGRLRLSCSEEQFIALVELLPHVFAFGPMSSWGTDVFIELGVLAAGLDDIPMSSLVKEQIEGISPLAISVMPPIKFSSVFDQEEISMFSYEQAAAVTLDQIKALTLVERTALAMVLTPWEDRNVDFRGRSLGLVLSPNLLCLSLSLLILLSMLRYQGT